MHKLAELFFKMIGRTPTTEDRLFADAFMPLLLERYAEEDVEYAIRFCGSSRQGIKGLGYLVPLIDECVQKRAGEEVKKAQAKMSSVPTKADVDRNKYLYALKGGKKQPC